MNDIIQQQIAFKLGPNPYYATGNVAQSIKTDMDSFPYTRYYRGNADSVNPIVFNREAGMRETHNWCYQSKKCICSDYKPTNWCWEGPCSVVLPCVPPITTGVASLDRSAINISP